MTMLSRTVASGRLVLLVALVYLAAPASTSASTIQISFTGLNLLYDGSTIYDSGGSNSTRPGNTSQADALSSMNFFVDGAPVGSFNSSDNIYADIRIRGVFNIPATGGTVLSAGPFPSFGFDLFIGSTILALEVDSPVEVNYSSGMLTVYCSGMTSSISHQGLPYGLFLGTPVSIGFSCFAPEVTDNGQYLTSFQAFGTGDARGPVALPVQTDPTTWSRIKQLFVK